MDDMISRMEAEYEKAKCGHSDRLDDHPMRAAIASMCHPTDGMIVDGYEAMKGDWKMCRDAFDDAERCWRAMIFNVLSSSESPSSEEQEKINGA